MTSQISRDYIHELSVTAHVDATDAADFLRTLPFPVCRPFRCRHAVRKETLSMSSVSEAAPESLWSKDYVFDIGINFLV